MLMTYHAVSKNLASSDGQNPHDSLQPGHRAKIVASSIRPWRYCYKDTLHKINKNMTNELLSGIHTTLIDNHTDSDSVRL